jgi:hypothetical protein
MNTSSPDFDSKLNEWLNEFAAQGGLNDTDTRLPFARLKKKYMPQVPQASEPERTEEPTPAHPNIRQAAQHFGTTPSAFRRLAKREGFKTVRIGNKDTFDLKELEAWWQAQAKVAVAV